MLMLCLGHPMDVWFSEKENSSLRFEYLNKFNTQFGKNSNKKKTLIDT